jgi:RhtB (resistance to homoserine/threonine) family protein
MKELLVIAIAHLLAVASPGPDLAVVAKNCMNGDIKDGIKTAFGIGAGIMTHIVLSLLGLALLLKSNQAVFNAVRIAGALYLIYLGYKSISNSSKYHIDKPSKTPTKKQNIFLSGYLTNILNPKATLFFLTLFTQVIPIETSSLVKSLYGLEMVVMTVTWFSLVSVILTHKKMRPAFEKYENKINRFFGLVLIAIGVVVISEML